MDSLTGKREGFALATAIVALVLVGALVKSIMAIATFAEANRDKLLELDVNPLMVRADGAVAVDALVVFGE